MTTQRPLRSGSVCLNVLLKSYHFLSPFTHTATYKEATMPVIEHYEKQGKVAEVLLKHSLSFACLIRLICQIDSTPTAVEVHTVAAAAVKKVLV